MKPFEGIFGNTCELRTIQYLLSLEGLEFDVSELAKEVGITRSPLTKALKRFVEWGLVNARTKKNVTYYSINRKSPIVETILQLDNLLIEKLLGEETLYEIHDYLENKKSVFKTSTSTSFIVGKSSITNSVDLNQNVFNVSIGSFHNIWSKPTNLGVIT